MTHYRIESINNCFQLKKQIYDLFFLCFDESYTAFEFYWSNVSFVHSYVMLDGSNIIGMCLNTIKRLVHQTHQIQALSISGVGIHPDYRGLQLSKQLLSYVLNQHTKEFDLILLQANDYHIYSWMQFSNNVPKHVAQLSHPFQYQMEAYPHNLHSFINYQLLYQIFVDHQFQQPTQLLWSYEEFCNYIKYKLANGERLYYTNRAYLFYQENEPITAFNYCSLQDLCDLSYLIRANQLVFYFNQTEWTWMAQHHYNPKLLRSETCLQINKPEFLSWTINLWDFFV